MDSALLELYQKGEITYDLALSHARDPDFIRHQTGDEVKLPTAGKEWKL